MSSKASLRGKNRQTNKKKELDKRRQSIRVLIFPRRKYARLVFVPIRANLRQSTLHKIFANKCKYNRERRGVKRDKQQKTLEGGVFSPRYIEMTVLKKDVDQRSQDILDIIFELEGRRHAKRLK